MRRSTFAALTVFLLITAAPMVRAEPSPILRIGEILRGDFVQERILAGFDAPLRTEGRFMLAPDQGLIWRAIEPFPITTVITPTGFVQRNKNRVLMRMSAANVPALGQLYDLLRQALLGDWRAFERLYHLRRSDRGKQWRVELRPREEAASASPFSVVVISGARFAQSIEIRKSDGDSDRLRFMNQALSSGPLGAEETSLLDSVEK